jgi:threonine synthase
VERALGRNNRAEPLIAWWTGASQVGGYTPRMGAPDMFYRCDACSTEYPRHTERWRCSCGRPLELISRPALRRADVLTSERSLWRYAAALPPELADSRVSYSEGLTPLLPAPDLAERLYVKLEFMFPSGSFKDRGTTVLVSEMNRLGRTSLMEDSSGNAGASLAMYAARARIQCEIFAPANTSAGKLVQIGIAGARLRSIPGSREDTAEAALQAADDPSQPFYASHNWHPMFVEGVKTVGFEIWEQLDFTVPDLVVAPAGNGSMILGLYEAFQALRAAGEIDVLPRIVAVQAAACAPLTAAFEAGADDVTPFDKQPTLAEGIASARPIRARQLLAAIRATRGSAVAVPEDSLLSTVRQLAALGFFVEPTSAVVAAVLPILSDRGILATGELTVLLLSGSGLKATERLLEA